MKNSLLQRRALYAALFVLLLSVVGMKNAFAQTQVATLQHGDSISAFYGQNALVEANSAAADGDIITLSGGTFSTPGTITKAITLRGAGCNRDSIAENQVTIIPGTVYLTIPNDSVFLTVEGVFFSGEVRYTGSILKHPTFIRCNFQIFDVYNVTSGLQDAQFINCKFSTCSLTGNNTNRNTFINCVIRNLTSAKGSQVFYNSYMNLGCPPSNLSAYNCIISSSNYYLCDNSVAYNTIGIKLYTGTNAFFYNMLTFDCMVVTSYADVFESFTGTFSLNEPFILKDEIASGFLGNDGKEIGIHGGYIPYNTRPTYMVPMRCNVANKSTIDGKLSVDIEVITVSE